MGRAVPAPHHPDLGEDEKVMTNITEIDASFAEEWNALPKRHRRQIRRLVRIGRPQENTADAEFAVRFADYQRSRNWYRLFWLWFIPLLIGGLVAAVMIHPLVVGVVGGLAANAVFVRRSYRRSARVNAALLDG